MASMPLPPGFRFHPTDVELVMYYLKRKVLGRKFYFEAISELNIYKFSPWDLPDKSCLKSRDLEWYFFCPRERKYASGGRMNRATETGYWKTTGKDRAVLYKDNNVGMVKTLVFHQGHAPNGKRTDWVIHEYRILDKQLTDAGISQDSYVLCKVFHKNGPGPKNSAQYGAPFKEEEWDHDVEDRYQTFPSCVPAGGGASLVAAPENPSCSVVTSKGFPESTSSWSLAEPGPSSGGAHMNLDVPNEDILRSFASCDGDSTLNPSCSFITSKAIPGSTSSWSLLESGPSSGGAPTNLDVPDDDIIRCLLSSCNGDNTLPSGHNDNNEVLDNNNHQRSMTSVPCSDGDDLYHDLGDLIDWPGLGDSGTIFSAIQEANCVLNLMPYPDAFLELSDLQQPLNSTAVVNLNENNPTGTNLNATHNSYSNVEGPYYGVNPFGTNQNNSGFNELARLPERSNSVGWDSEMLQANGDGTDANKLCNASCGLAFTEADESRGIEQNY